MNTCCCRFSFSPWAPLFSEGEFAIFDLYLHFTWSFHLSSLWTLLLIDSFSRKTQYFFSPLGTGLILEDFLPQSSLLSGVPVCHFNTYSRVSFGRSCMLNWKAINYCNWFEHSLWKGDSLRYAQKSWPQTPRKCAAFRGNNWCPLNPVHHPAMEPSLTSKVKASVKQPPALAVLPQFFFTTYSTTHHTYY